MDKLAREAFLARQAGMTYGKWKALQPIVPKKKDVIPEGWRKCVGCGKEFKPNRGNHIYCDMECRARDWARKHKEVHQVYYEKYREKHIEYMRDYRRRKKEEKADGKD